MENNEVQPIGVTQKTMATIADVVTSTINRAICAAGFSPIPSKR